MSCYHPLKGFKIGINPSGKPKYKITSYECNGVLREKGSDSWKEVYDLNITTHNYHPIIKYFGNDKSRELITDFIEIPCGHCIGCRLDRSRQWADRCMCEAKYHDKNCFITLTYNDENLDKYCPIVEIYNDIDDVQKYNSLDKSELQKFFKRLRKKLDEKYGIKIRYYACGEYGSKSARPHYHAIIFGYDFSDDRVIYKQNFNGDILYNSKLLSEAWPYGFSVVAECNWNTCSYVARYCTKKSNLDRSIDLRDYGLAAEFTCMSRRPGIARRFYDDNYRDMYRFDCVHLPTEKGSIKIRPCRYFDKLYDIENPEDMQRIKNKRMAKAIFSKTDILMTTDLEYLDYLKVKEDNIIARTKILDRKEL